MQTALRRTISRLVVIALVVACGLGLSPGTANAITLGQLIRGDEIDEMVIDNLRFFNFRDFRSLTLPPGEIAADPDEIIVETLGNATHHPGLKFTANSKLSVTASSGTITQFTFLSYDVETVDGTPLIKDNSLNFYPGCEVGGSFSQVNIQENIFDAHGAPVEGGRKQVSITFVDGSTLDEKLSDEAEFSEPKSFVSITTSIAIQAKPQGMEPGRISVSVFEQKFTLASLANAGSDQVVFDRVLLDAGHSLVEGTFVWELYRKDGDELVHVATKDGVVAEFKDLERGFYEAKVLLTTFDEETFSDTALVAAAGQCEAKTPETNGHLTVSRFKIKQYKKCNWSYASVSGKVDIPYIRDLGISNGDDLEGIVTIQVRKEGEPVLTLSDDVKLKAKDRWRKFVIRKY